MLQPPFAKFEVRSLVSKGTFQSDVRQPSEAAILISKFLLRSGLIARGKLRPNLFFRVATPSLQQACKDREKVSDLPAQEFSLSALAFATAKGGCRRPVSPSLRR
jgi:hypothetical protein